MESLSELLTTTVEGDREAGARENRGRERAGSEKTRGRQRDLYEGGKREQK